MESIAGSVVEVCTPKKAATSALWSKDATTEALQCLRELDWSWLYASLEQQAGIVTEVDQNSVLEELLRFIVIKVSTCDLDEVNHLFAVGVVNTAFQTMLLNPFFCTHVMRLLKHPGHVLSNSFAHGDDNEQRIRKYIQHYKELFGSDPPQQLPSSGSSLCPVHLLQSRGLKRKEPAMLPTAAIDPTAAISNQRSCMQEVQRSGREIGSESGQIFVKSLKKGNTVSCSFADLHSAKVADLVQMLQDTHGIPADQQKLIWSGSPIHSPHRSKLIDEDGERKSQLSLASLGIGSGSILHLVLTMKGHCSCVPPGARGTVV